MLDYPILQISGKKVQVLGDQHFGRKFTNGVPIHRRGEREKMMIRHLCKHMLDMDCDIQRWPRSPGQFGGDDKLFPGSDYAASFMLAAITTAGACPGGGDGGLM